MKTEIRETLTCPKCGKVYTGRPALSRIDYSPICPDCYPRN